MWWLDKEKREVVGPWEKSHGTHRPPVTQAYYVRDAQRH